VGIYNIEYFEFIKQSVSHLGVSNVTE